MNKIISNNEILDALEYYTKVNSWQNHKFIIITDENLKNIYTNFIDAISNLELINVVKVIPITPGEHSKSREIKAFIEDEMFYSDCLRDTVVIAFGGGVVLDLAGFIAATFCRGVPAIYIPTSLLAQVDASIGGKTGINTKFGKNLIGAFKQPKAVFISCEFIETLSLVDYVSAYSEIIKHALISSKEYFDFLLENSQKALGKDKDFVNKTVKKSIDIKSQIVNKDEKEKGLREILNFGHTIGHAIEKACDYSISHGQAVAYGIIIESHISYNLGFLSKQDYEKIIKILNIYNFEGLLFPELNKINLIQNIIKYLYSDKKNRDNEIKMVLINHIGQVSIHNNKYSHSINISYLENSLKYFFEKS